MVIYDERNVTLWINTQDNFITGKKIYSRTDQFLFLWQKIYFWIIYRKVTMWFFKWCECIDKINEYVIYDTCGGIL
jgi:hypothetical protein